jgi:hypothetical protein
MMKDVFTMERLSSRPQEKPRSGRDGKRSNPFHANPTLTKLIQKPDFETGF